MNGKTRQCPILKLKGIGSTTSALVGIDVCKNCKRTSCILDKPEYNQDDDLQSAPIETECLLIKKGLNPKDRLKYHKVCHKCRAVVCFYDSPKLVALPVN